MKDRLRIISLCFIVGMVCLVSRLFYWQVVRGEDLTQAAQSQQKSASGELAKRGNILARDGSFLVASRNLWLLFADMPNLENPSEVAEALTPFTVENTLDQASISAEKTRLLTLLNQKNSAWVPLKTRLSTDQRNTILEKKITGIGFDELEGRFYPEASAAAQVLGFVGKDSEGNDTGYFGLEGQYDLILSGKPGYEEQEKNAVGVPLLFGENRGKSAQQGVDLVTTIDKTVQVTIERHLREGIAKYEAKSGSVVVMDPSNGAILGMTSLPSYDPAVYWDHENAEFLNPVISASFEPGSIMKPLVMAAGFDAKVITPTTICDICAAPYKVDKYFIETWDRQYHANSTMQEVIIHSDNVGMVFIGNHLGADKLYDYFDNFGLGKPTGIDLQGEMTPRMRPRGTWSIVDQATATFGQGIAVTPIQMVTGFAAIANGGYHVTPHVVQTLSSGSWSHKVVLPEKKRVISQEASSQMKDILVSAVAFGEAKWAVPKGYRVAGKSGTAQIPVGGHYDAEKTNASFIAFAPPENPKMLMLITINEPQSSQWASETAAPLWFTIARDIFPYLGIMPENY